MIVRLHEEAIGGVCTGILGITIGYHLDLVKTRMQTSTATKSSMIQVGTNVVRNGEVSLFL